MMRLFALLLLSPALVAAESLDEAIELVMQVNPEITAQQAEVTAIGRQSSWSSRVRLGYSYGATSDEAAGLNAGVTVEIPLFSRKREIEAAKAHSAVAQTRDKVLNAFLSDVATLAGLEAKRAEAEEMAAFYRDRLKYFRQAVEEGRVESDTLWADAEKAKKAEHDHRQGAIALAAALTESARRFGGTEWKRLRALLAAYLKQAQP